MPSIRLWPYPLSFPLPLHPYSADPLLSPLLPHFIISSIFFTSTLSPYTPLSILIICSFFLSLVILSFLSFRLLLSQLNCFFPQVHKFFSLYLFLPHHLFLMSTNAWITSPNFSHLPHYYCSVIVLIHFVYSFLLYWFHYWFWPETLKTLIGTLSQSVRKLHVCHVVSLVHSTFFFLLPILCITSHSCNLLNSWTCRRQNIAVAWALVTDK